MAAPYRHFIQPEADAEFPAEAGRYHLYMSYTCPFACRVLAAINLKGLEDVISFSIAHPVYQKTRPNDESDDHKGWTFVDPAADKTYAGANGNEYSTEDCIPDTVNHTKCVRDLYELVSKDPRRFTVPLLWDKKKQTIVSDESADMLRMVNASFRAFVKTDADVLPEGLVEQVEAANEGLVETIDALNYKVIFAQSDEDHAQAAADYFAHIQAADEILAKSRYIVGNSITEADLRLFHSLIRFDLQQRDGDKFALSQYPNLVNYLRDLYQTPAIKSTVNWYHLKFTFVNVAPTLVGHAPSFDYDAPHDRATRFAN